jgi:hypothetical protein
VRPLALTSHDYEPRIPTDIRLAADKHGRTRTQELPRTLTRKDTERDTDHEVTPTDMDQSGLGHRRTAMRSGSRRGA